MGDPKLDSALARVRLMAREDTTWHLTADDRASLVMVLGAFDALVVAADIERDAAQAEPAPIDTLRMHAAVDAAGFRVSLDLHGMATLWCKECGRDSGYHSESCSKAASR